jgi:hypothetical protein
MNKTSDIPFFDDWLKGFLSQTAYSCTSSGKKSDAEKIPIQDVIKKIDLIPVTIKTPEILRQNILDACYQASIAPNPSSDANAKTRTELQSFLSDLPKAKQNIQLLFNFIDKHPYYIKLAFDLDENPKLKTSSSGYQKISKLEILLADLEAGLMDFDADYDHPALISSSDFTYGPFEFAFDLNKDWKSKGTNASEAGVNILQTGLMFHLAYLFRYFSMNTPRQEREPFSRGPFFKNDILEIDGEAMLKEGKPHHHLVAVLTNAVFEKKFTSHDVKDRLDSISKPKAGTKHSPIFIGW